MSYNIAKRTLLSSIIAASSLSTLALAQQQEGFTITPSIGNYAMDNARNLEDDTAYSLGLGYQFNNPWAVEFVYLNADTKRGGNDVDVDQYRLDGLYHLPEINSLNLTPYVAAGVGTTDFHNGRHNNAQVNAGGGLKYAVNDSVAVRADFRVVNDVEDHHLDNVASLGVQMTFGGPSRQQTNENSYTAVQSSYTQSEPEPKSTQETLPTETVEPNIAYRQGENNSDEESVTTTLNDKAASEKDSAPNMAQAAPVEQAQPIDQAKEAPVAQEDKPQLTMKIEFDTGKTQVEQKYYPEIEKLASYLKQHPDSTVEIEGHTDDTGAASYNQTVSEQRANAIANVLVRTFDISEDRVNAVGYGEEKPLVPNDSAEHRQANRRVIAVISQDSNA